MTAKNMHQSSETQTDWWLNSYIILYKLLLLNSYLISKTTENTSRGNYIDVIDKFHRF